MVPVVCKYAWQFLRMLIYYRILVFFLKDWGISEKMPKYMLMREECVIISYSQIVGHNAVRKWIHHWYTQTNTITPGWQKIRCVCCTVKLICNSENGNTLEPKGKWEYKIWVRKAKRRNDKLLWKSIKERWELCFWWGHLLIRSIHFSKLIKFYTYDTYMSRESCYQHNGAWVENRSANIVQKDNSSSHCETNFRLGCLWQ